MRERELEPVLVQVLEQVLGVLPERVLLLAERSVGLGVSGQEV